MLSEVAVYNRFEAIFKKSVKKAEGDLGFLYGGELPAASVKVLKDKAMVFAIVREINQEILDDDGC